MKSLLIVLGSTISCTTIVKLTILTPLFVLLPPSIAPIPSLQLRCARRTSLSFATMTSCTPKSAACWRASGQCRASQVSAAASSQRSTASFSSHMCIQSALTWPRFSLDFWKVRRSLSGLPSALDCCESALMCLKLNITGECCYVCSVPTCLRLILRVSSVDLPVPAWDSQALICISLALTCMS